MPANYILNRSKRKTLTIKVKDGKLYVYAPLTLSTEKIEEFINKHQRWIDKRLNDDRTNVNFDLANDSEICYKGHIYDLKVILSSKYSLEIDGATLILKGRSIDSITKNFKKHLCDIILVEVNSIKEELNVDFDLNFKTFKSKWGCCYKNKRLIVMNVLSANLDKYTLRSVIYHEIAHLKVANHQKEFYDYLATLNPHYYLDNKRLKSYTI